MAISSITTSLWRLGASRQLFKETYYCWLHPTSSRTYQLLCPIAEKVYTCLGVSAILETGRSIILELMQRLP